MARSRGWKDDRPWLHVWGPALVAAVVGATPGTIALIQQAPQTRVELRNRTAWAAYARGGGADLTIDARVVNESDHEVVLEDGGCNVQFKDETAEPGQMLTTRARQIGGVVIKPRQGLPVTCTIDAVISGVSKPAGYLIGRDTAQVSLRVDTNDGQSWGWDGLVPVVVDNTQRRG